MSCGIYDDAKLFMQNTSSIVIQEDPILYKAVTNITSPENHMHENILVRCDHMHSPNQQRHCLMRFCNCTCNVYICSCIERVLLPSVMLRTPTSCTVPRKSSTYLMVTFHIIPCRYSTLFFSYLTIIIIFFHTIS